MRSGLLLMREPLRKGKSGEQKRRAAGPKSRLLSLSLSLFFFSFFFFYYYS